MSRLALLTLSVLVFVLLGCGRAEVKVAQNDSPVADQPAPRPQPNSLPAAPMPRLASEALTPRVEGFDVRETGGNAATERAVALGLAWLARQQKKDGSWAFDGTDKDDTAAATGLALLAFLGANQTHMKDGGKYNKNVAAALEFLMKNTPLTGANAGKIENAKSQSSRAIAVLALCEAYGITKDATIKRFAQAALNHIEKNQAKDGGWADEAGDPSDTVVTGWHVQALQAAKFSADVIVDDRVIRKARGFLDGVAGGSTKAMYGATDRSDARPGTKPTAVGLLCRCHIDQWGSSAPGLAEGVAGLLKNPPHEQNRDIAYLYPATQVVQRFGGEEWKTWNEGPKQADGTRKGGLRDLLVGSQLTDNKVMDTFGSWKVDGGEVGRRGGRFGTTVYSLLTLEVYDRVLLLYKGWAENKNIEDR